MCTLTLGLWGEGGGHNKRLEVSGRSGANRAHPQVYKAVLAKCLMECVGLDCDSGIPVLVHGVFMDGVLMTTTSQPRSQAVSLKALRNGARTMHARKYRPQSTQSLVQGLLANHVTEYLCLDSGSLLSPISKRRGGGIHARCQY